ncbi:hypothetical protein H6P81_018313 [Aristolochia fimbriata]|uniref:Reverse transcriptase/retrotransposon-derived protein RNase H-like domain-containing protein n=1 Tax=Aristolochia fimbriata TaxID=158543 RepID=A0AAV7E106_ARIFI|nr:hypothetical protein H6P81_018313 [Aristolochia fimbriata]
MARAGGNFTKDQLHEKPPVALPVLTAEQEKLRKEAKKKAAMNPVIIYTLKAAIARARAYDSVTVNHISVADNNQEDDEFILKEAPTTFEEGNHSTVDELKKKCQASTHKSQCTSWRFIHQSGQSNSCNDGSGQNSFPKLRKKSTIDRCKFHKRGEVSILDRKYCTVKKKNGQIRVCIDFHDLNKACLKDDFPLPITELIVDTTTGHKALSFMDGVIPFGLKNAVATYLWAMQNIFDDFLHKRVECYVDDLVVKSKERSGHLLDLRAMFERLRQFQMPEPINISELKSFQSHLAYIRRFISNFARRCQPFSRLMKKDTPFEWDESCWNAFNNLKAYLTKPPVLVAPIVDRPLLLYIIVQEKSVGALLAQCDEDNKERSLYYLS